MTHDKAKWHLEGKFPSELDSRQAYVPGGLLLAWLAQKDLLSAMVETDFPDEVAKLRSRSMTGAEAYKLLGGVLDGDLMSPEADDFLAAYLDPDKVGYWDDYGTLCAGLPSEYHVNDNWSVYDRLAPLIDSRFARWRAQTS